MGLLQIFSMSLEVVRMRVPNKCFRFLILASLAALTAAVSTSPVSAQPEKPGRLVVSMKAADASLDDRPVMVSAIRDGRIVNQYEVFLDGPPQQAGVTLDGLAPGEYDVRIEGDGVVTEVKRGVLVFANRDGSLRAMVRPGQGVHIVEYATGGLSREEVAARLAKLESSVEELKKATDKPQD